MELGDPLPIGVIIQELAVPMAFIIGLVLALVEFCKKLGAKDMVSLALAMVFGILLGGGYYLAAFGVPAGITSWFLLIVVALIPGLAESGVYDFSTNKARVQADTD